MSVTPIDPSDRQHDAAALARRRSPARQWAGGVVRIFEHDGGLLDGLDAESAAAARARGVAPTLMVGTGTWTPPGDERWSRVLGLLVLDGLLVRCAEVEGIRCPELLGRGDLLRPWDGAAQELELGVTSSWKVIEPVTLAVLDGRFAELQRRWPQIGVQLLSRTIERSRSLAFRSAIPHVRRADDRLRMLFRDLATRWGRVTPEGVVLPLPLTNQLIAELACLRRPTTSTTMTRLAREGQIVRRDGGGFLLDLPEPASDCSRAAA